MPKKATTTKTFEDVVTAIENKDVIAQTSLMTQIFYDSIQATEDFCETESDKFLQSAINYIDKHIYEKIKRNEPLTTEEKSVARPDREFMINVFEYIMIARMENTFFSNRI